MVLFSLLMNITTNQYRAAQGEEKLRDEEGNTLTVNEGNTASTLGLKV